MLENVKNIWEEISKRFKQEDLLGESWKSILKMIEFDEEMFTDAYHILRKEFSEEKINILRKKDQEVNSLQISVRENVLKHLVVANKYKHELSFALGIVTIVNGLERIGDNCKNIADLAMISQKKMDFGKIEPVIQSLESMVFKHFAMLKEAFEEKDRDLCREIMMSYKDSISVPVDTTVSKIIHGDFSDLPQDQIVTAAVYLRYLKRVDANQKNVASIMVNPFANLGYKVKE